ncbi:hypothetical protein Nepgr_017691 [Nepenthes gracilis]|uniref:Zinc finger LSD1-type domain-containing protein n=1 Tax=Nepenthes gracilis TaxID=150966 RepID=A0AAD3SRX2_NEPGR|nr:hypothetical protein Nepgr_017691 [Nepenthes gracilis]
MMGDARMMETPQHAEEGKEKQEKEEEAAEGPPPGWESTPPPLLPPLVESAQMVCGSCRHLLSYPRGSRHVQCTCCQTVNFVLEEHEVGQVKCGNCAVLLMYPYGVQSVRSTTDGLPCLFNRDEQTLHPAWLIELLQFITAKAKPVRTMLAYADVDEVFLCA